MVTVCAWCQKSMGSKEPLDDPGVTHGICSACVERQAAEAASVLVVSPARAGTIPALNTLLGGDPSVSIVVDRRNGERRQGGGNGSRPSTSTAVDRRVDDRRRGPGLYLV